MNHLLCHLLVRELKQEWDPSELQMLVQNGIPMLVELLVRITVP